MKVGDWELVPCLIREIKLKAEMLDEQKVWMDLEPPPPGHSPQPNFEYVPIIDHPHNDVENGQKEVHYHRDRRYYSHPDSWRYTIGGDFRPMREDYDDLVYLKLTVASLDHYMTPVGLISKSKLKHKCIHKGKCPHRGFDLSNVEAFGGVITCPLHGLRFDKNTKQLVGEHDKFLQNN